MLVGVLNGPSLATYQEAVRLAPIQFIAPPMVWLSSPEESLLSAAVSHFRDEGTISKIVLKCAAFRHLYNPGNQLPGFYAALVPSEGSIRDMRHRLGVLQWEDPFVPVMLLCHDGMRSKASRAFCNSLANYLINIPLSFELFVTDASNPDHQTAFDNYNTEAVEVFEHQRKFF